MTTQKRPCTYILANKKQGTLYIGVTSDLPKRIQQHKHNQAKGFTDKYNIHKLVHCEFFDKIQHAIEREKQLKNWKRNWKIELIEKDNPNWEDLSGKFLLF